MKFFSKTPNINFLGRRTFAMIFSGLLLLIGIGSFVAKGFTYGIDFSGGTLVQVKFEEKPKLEDIRSLFQEKLKTIVGVTTYGDDGSNELLITISQTAFQEFQKAQGEEEGTISTVDRFTGIFKSQEQKFDIRRVETVGPKVGDDLKNKAVLAVLYCLIGILAYIWFRFKFYYGLGAVAALFHDVIITLGIFALFEREITLTVVAALLTIVGYSLNDTIVVFDRIRENVAKLPKKGLFDIVNLSVNESLSRTILTSVTTLFVVLTLFISGGDIIHDFSLALLIGIVIGTYSSVFVASPVMMYFEARSRKPQNSVQKEPKKTEYFKETGSD